MESLLEVQRWIANRDVFRHTMTWLSVADCGAIGGACKVMQAQMDWNTVLMLWRDQVNWKGTPDAVLCRLRKLELVQRRILGQTHIKVGGTLYACAVAHYSLKQYEMTLVLCCEAMLIARQHKDNTLKANICNYRGLVCSMRDLRDQAIPWYQQAVQLAVMPDAKSLYLYNIAVDYEGLAQYDLSMVYLTMAETTLPHSQEHAERIAKFKTLVKSHLYGIPGQARQDAL